MNYPTECFPAWQVHHKEPILENLNEFGSFGNANITNDSHRFNTNFEFQKLHGAEGQHKLSAKTSTLPFLPPNIEKLEAGSCLQDTSDYRKLLMKYHDYLICYKSIVKKNYREQKEYLQFYSKLNKCTKKPSCKLTMKPWLEKIVKTKLELKHHQKKNLRFLTSNWLYSGGCLSFLKNPQGSSIGYLLHATGAELDTLTVTPIQANEDLMRTPFMVQPCMENEQFFPIRRTIYQVHSALCETDGFFTVRTQDSAYLFQLTSIGNFLLIDTCEGLGDFTSTIVSPHFPAEYVLALNDGAIYYRNAELKSCNLVYNGIEHVPPVEKWWHCSFGAHPRCLMVASRSSFLRKDLRSRNTAMDLFTFPNIHVTSEDLLYQTLMHPRNDFQHFLATTHNLILMDERYPNASLLQWQHSLTTPPLYCSATLDVLENNQDVVVLASQEAQEAICFQTGLTSHNAPCSTCSPWRLACFDKFLKKEAFIDISKLISERLTAPLIGLCSVPHIIKGFTGLVMSCYGDIFGQSFFSSSPIYNEIFDDINAPYASCVDDTDFLYFNGWLQRLKKINLKVGDDAELETSRAEFKSSGYKSEGSGSDGSQDENEPKSSHGDGDTQVSCVIEKKNTCNILPILDSFRELEIAHKKCSLCSDENVYIGQLMRLEFCNSCEMMLTKSKHFKRCAQKGLILEDPSFHASDNCSLNLIDLSLSQDPVSNSLLKIWTDEHFEEEMVNLEKVNQEVVNQEMTKQEMYKQRMIKQKIVHQEMTKQKIVNQQIISQEIVNQDTASQEMFSQEMDNPQTDTQQMNMEIVPECFLSSSGKPKSPKKKKDQRSEVTELSQSFMPSQPNIMSLKSDFPSLVLDCPSSEWPSLECPLSNPDESKLESILSQPYIKYHTSHPEFLNISSQHVSHELPAETSIDYFLKTPTISPSKTGKRRLLPLKRKSMMGF